jgi:hypothetical protein
LTIAPMSSVDSRENVQNDLFRDAL